MHSIGTVCTETIFFDIEGIGGDTSRLRLRGGTAVSRRKSFRALIRAPRRGWDDTFRRVIRRQGVGGGADARIGGLLRRIRISGETARRIR